MQERGLDPGPFPPMAFIQRRLRQRLLALGLAWFGPRHDRLLADRKRALFASLTGTVVEIGPGTGPNLRHYPRGIRWIGIEPNPFMRIHLEAEARRTGSRVRLLSGRAEALPLASASVDGVVATLVLCSVEDVQAALSEIRRVLKPGAPFVFIEHVGAPRGTWLRWLQRALRPLTRCAGDGCHPDRETWTPLEASGLTLRALEHFRLRIPVVSPHISGIALVDSPPLAPPGLAPAPLAANRHDSIRE